MKLRFAAALVSGIIAVSAVTGAAPVRFSITDSSAADYADEGTRSYAYTVISLINDQRSANGLAPLKISSQINSAAVTRAYELPTEFSHYRPDGSLCFSAVTEMGISYYNIGENIACGQSSPQEAVNCWMNSDAHRANILNPDFEFTGVGVVNSGGTYYWTQMFITSDDLVEEGAEPAPEPEPVAPEPPPETEPPVVETAPPTEPPTTAPPTTTSAPAVTTTTAPPKPKVTYHSDYVLRARTYMTNYFRINFGWDMSDFYDVNG